MRKSKIISFRKQIFFLISENGTLYSIKMTARIIFSLIDV